MNISYRKLRSAVEAALFAQEALPGERAQLMHLLRQALPAFKSFLEYPVPKAADRSQVLSKEVQLPNSPPTFLDDQDVQIAIKLSDDLNLNEVDAVALLVAAHQEWGLLGREPLEILRLAAGLWFEERKALISILFILLKVVVLDEGSGDPLIVEICTYLEDLFSSGLRQRLFALITELNREEPAGFGGPQADRYMIDLKGVLVERYTVDEAERLCLSQCASLSVLIVGIDSHDAKNMLSLLKACAADMNTFHNVLKAQIAYTVLFGLVIALMSDGLTGNQEYSTSEISDMAFRREFQTAIMSVANDAIVDGYLDIVRLAWAVYLMMISDGSFAMSSASLSQVNDSANSKVCLDRACSKNAFKFLLVRIIQTAAFQNDDPEMVFVFDAYLHKMLTSFLSHATGRDKIKELKDMAMSSFGAYSYGRAHDSVSDDSMIRQQEIDNQSQPFICLLELLTEIYEKEPRLIDGTEALWNFVRFAGEDHVCYQTLVAFLNLLAALASSEEGAKKVYFILESKTIRSVGWHTLFNSLNVYEKRLKHLPQKTSTMLSDIAEGDAKALVGYLKVLRKVMTFGSPVERKMWFPDIEPLFKLLPYENVPAYLKGALRDAICTFVEQSLSMKDTVWGFMVQYDLPVDLSPTVNRNVSRDVSAPVYDMRYELNEIEARSEEYPSTLSYIRLLNVLIKRENDLSDNGRRFMGIFKFIRDDVFGPFSQRAYANQVEKWELAVACLEHFKMLLSMYNVSEDDIRKTFDDSGQEGVIARSAGVNMVEIPAIELIKDFMSGKTIFRNVMSIVMLRVHKVAEDRCNQIYGSRLEEAVALCLELIILVLQRDSFVADHWRPIFQPLDVILAHDGRQIVALLEYVSYELLPSIQQSSIKIMNILSGRMVQLVSIIKETDGGWSLIEDYAACLEARSLEYQAPERPNEDIGFLILQLLINNVSRPVPNVTHFLLRFDIDGPVEKSVLQPKHHYSCLRIILNTLETLSKSEVNAILHEFGFQLVYELCVDPVTGPSMVELLHTEKYEFFVKHLNSFACTPLPKRNNQMQRISELQQRSWLLKILAYELHVCDMDVVVHRESCRRLISKLFSRDSIVDNNLRNDIYELETMFDNMVENVPKMKVLELLDIFQFQSPEMNTKFWDPVIKYKIDFKVDEILDNRNTVELGGVYYYSERGDRLIDLTAFRDKLWQEYRRLEGNLNFANSEARISELKNAVEQLLRWGWKYNKNLEEEAAQLHMLVAWSQVVEVAISKRADMVKNGLHALYELLDACLTATISHDCSLKIALTLTQVALTCMAKLQDQGFWSAEEENADNVTYIDLLRRGCLSNTACHSILLKLISAVLRQESSEALRRRQYAIFLAYFQYCRGMTDPEVSLTIKRNLLLEGHDADDDIEIQKIDKDQAELMRMNLTILKRESSTLVELIVKDATLGSDMGKAMAFYVLDALISVDQEQVFLTQIQKRDLLRICLSDISKDAYQAVLLPSAESIRRIYTIEAELAMLLRVCYQYRKRGLQTLLSMGVLEQLSCCRAIDVQLMEDSKGSKPFSVSMGLPSQHVRYHQLVGPVLRLVFSSTSLIDVSEFLETTNKVVAEIIDFVKAHQGLFASILREDRYHISLHSLQELELAVGILSKVWPYEENDELGILQALFSLMHAYFCGDAESGGKYMQYIQCLRNASDYNNEHVEIVRKIELLVTRLRCSLISYLYCLVRRKDLRLPVSRPKIFIAEGSSGNNSLVGKMKLPELAMIVDLLSQASIDLQYATEEKCHLLTKIHDVNELSRHEVDEIIELHGSHKYVSVSDGIRKRRKVAMVEMCSALGHHERQTTLLLHVLEHALNILYVHFESRLRILDRYKKNVGSSEDIMTLNGKIFPVLENLEGLSEDQVGHPLKLLHRLVHSLKSIILLKRTQ